MLSSTSVIFAFSFFLYSGDFVKTNQTTGNPNFKSLDLPLNIHNSSLSIDYEVTQVQLFCPFGTHWILPSTAKLVNSSIELKQSVNMSSSHLLIGLSQDNVSRMHLRGLYQCCHVDKSALRNPNLEFRAPEPSCCPCCPWYKQPKCTLQWSPELERFVPDNKYDKCSSLFLYTNSVPLEFEQIQIVRGEPSLIPCAAPMEPLPGLMEFKIDYQLIPSPFARESWFPFDSALKSRIKHTYDPRFGLCLFQSEFPRPVYVLTCSYSTYAQERLIQPIWPPPSPVIKPYVMMKFEKAIDMKRGTLNRSRPDLTKLYLEFSQENDLMVSTYRLPKRTRVRARCVAAYTDHRIVSQPPSSLCFQWRVGPYPLDLNDSSKLPASSWSDLWNFTKCHQIQIINQTTAPFVVALDELSLPILEQNVSVACRVLPQSRESPFGQQVTHLIVVDQQMNQTLRLLKTNLNTNTQTKLLTSNQSESLNKYANQIESYALFYKTQPIQLRIAFWAFDELGAEPYCKPICSTFAVDCPLKFENLILERQHDKWVCSINVTNNSSSSSFGVASMYMINVTVGVGQISKTLQLVTLNHTLLFKPHVEGLHGNIQKPVQLKCKTGASETSNWKDLNLESVQKVIWKLKWDNKSDIREIGFENGLSHFDLFLESIYDEFKEPWIELQQLENGSYAISYNQSSEEQWTVEKWPRRLCVSCELVYPNRSDSSEDKCQTLSQWTLGRDTNNLSVIIHSQLQNWTKMVQIGLHDQVKNIAILRGSQVELRCAAPNPMTGSWRQLMFHESWPNIHQVNWSSLSTNITNTKRIRITPYSKVMHISLSNLNKTDLRMSYTCNYSGQALPFTMQIVDPVEPFIIEPHQPNKLFEEGSQVKLKCLASGVPKPVLEWRRLVEANSTQTKAIDWMVVKQCEPMGLHFESQNFSSCTHIIETSPDDQQILVQCHAHSPVGISIRNLTLTGLMTSQKASSNSSKLEYHILWTTIILLPLLVIVLLIISVTYFNLHKMKIYSNLVHIQNLLYRKPYYETHHDEANRTLLNVFDSVDEVLRFAIPRDSIQITPISLGLGHYGQVMKGWLDWKYADHSEPLDPLDKEQKVAVAVKTCSGELASFKCLQNEISLLSRLNQSPNVVKMFGLLVGHNPDLIDTSLVMEYCHQKSLNEFIRKYGYQIRRRSNSSLNYYKTEIPDLELDDTRKLGLQSDSNENDLEPMETKPSMTQTMRKPIPVSVDYYKVRIKDLYSISLGIVNGVEYLMKNNIIHRDLATRNILLSNKMIPKICDFGLAVRFTTDHMNDEYCNTDPDRERFYRIITHTKQLPFRILPPEALQDQLFYFASDIWQYGLLLWQMFHLEEKKPFNSIKTVDQLCNLLQTNQKCNSILLEPVQVPYGCLDKPYLMVDSLWHMVCQMWSFNHEQRPNATEIRQFIENLLDTPVDWEQELLIQYKSRCNNPSDTASSNEQSTLNKQLDSQHSYVNQTPCSHQNTNPYSG